MSDICEEVTSVSLWIPSSSQIGYMGLPLVVEWLRICLAEGNGTPLQYSCLENPMDGGAWKAAVHGVAEGCIRLSVSTFPFSLSCIGEGNGNPLQCSFLENPRDGGALRAAVYGVAQSRTRLKWLSSSSKGCSFDPWSGTEILRALGQRRPSTAKQISKQ